MLRFTATALRAWAAAIVDYAILRAVHGAYRALRGRRG